jgi:hypothetical protein
LETLNSFGHKAFKALLLTSIKDKKKESLPPTTLMSTHRDLILFSGSVSTYVPTTLKSLKLKLILLTLLEAKVLIKLKIKKPPGLKEKTSTKVS